MTLPAKAHYAAVAMIELARQFGSGQPVAVRSISDEHSVPLPFLVQILQQLKASGLVSSTRGPAGGYRLERSPDSIQLLEIVDAVCPPNANGAQEAAGSSRTNQILLDVWEELEANYRNALAAISLSDLEHRVQASASAMFYI